MNAALEHRGPDDEGVHGDPRGGMTLGARRLSIIDVEGGHQPLSNEDGTVWAALNGEIYNHPALREQLLDRGHRLATRTDTEVLVHLYEDHGEDLVHALEGMFAFAIWDASERRLILGRDRFGEKPLFYREREGSLSFASELTALLAPSGSPSELSPEVVDAYFVLGYVPGPASIVRGVSQLAPASLLVWEPGRRARTSSYWSPPLEVDDPPLDYDELVGETETVLRRAVRSRMLSDVPLGVFLSGGVDSTLVAAISAQESRHPLQTFSVGYDVGSVNETHRAREVAETIGAEHHELCLGVDDVAGGAASVLARLDQPLADPSLLATHALSEFARETVTVVVGGEGADELFGGYPRYRWLTRAHRLGGRVPRPIAALGAAAIKRGAPGRAKRLADVLEPKTMLERHVDWVSDGRRHLTPTLYGPRLGRGQRNGLPQLLSDDIGEEEGTVAGRFLRLDQRRWLPDDVLAKADRASMLASLELRTPYLHRELAELTALVPASQHVARPGKRLLRTILDDRLGLSSPPRKTAFNVPVAEWLRGPLAGLLEGQLRDGALFRDGWFERVGVADLVRQHQSGRRDNSAALWPILTLGVWLDAQHGREAG